LSSLKLGLKFRVFLASGDMKRAKSYRAIMGSWVLNIVPSTVEDMVSMRNFVRLDVIRTLNHFND
jgi:hypothetical protein